MFGPEVLLHVSNSQRKKTLPRMGSFTGTCSPVQQTVTVTATLTLSKTVTATVTMSKIVKATVTVTLSKTMTLSKTVTVTAIMTVRRPPAAGRAA